VARHGRPACFDECLGHLHRQIERLVAASAHAAAGTRRASKSEIVARRLSRRTLRCRAITGYVGLEWSKALTRSSSARMSASINATALCKSVDWCREQPQNRAVSAVCQFPRMFMHRSSQTDTNLQGSKCEKCLFHGVFRGSFETRTASGRGATGGRLGHRHLRLGSQASDVGARHIWSMI
jgi:hypothetical protein